MSGPVLRAVEAGAGSPALVMVHGFSCAHDDWTPQLDALSARRRCVAIDLPGHGASAPPAEPTIAALGAAVVDALDALGIDDAVLAGHSMGCRVVAEAFVRDRTRGRIRGLVLVDGSFVDGDPAAVCASVEAAIDAQGIEGFLERLYRDFHVEATPDAVRARVDAHRPRIDRALARALIVDLFRWDASRGRATYAAIDVPVLAIQSTVLDGTLRRVPVRAGERSPFAAAIADCVPHARIETIACGHFTMLEAPDETSRLIAGFVDALPAPPAAR
ncbi:MAG: hypothetical protein RJA99_1344 [Pseudomonadota bacterium]